MNRAKKMKENTNLAPLPTEPPPDPLDKSPSYMDMLRDQIIIPNSAEDLHMPSLNTLDATVIVSKGAINLTEEGTTVITLFDEDKQRNVCTLGILYYCQVTGKRIIHQYL
ncbi:hypothetical protein EJD97_020615, partial [Solanum chilense]